MGTKTVPLFNTSQGISAGNQVSGFYRRLNSRAREFLYLRGKLVKSSKEHDDMINLFKSLPRATPPNCDRPEEWKNWRNLVWWGLWRVEESIFKAVLSSLLFRARQIEASYGANRYTHFKNWLTANAPSGDASVFRWLRERPPFVNAPVDEELNILGYGDACNVRASVFSDIWERTDTTEFQDGHNADLVWPVGLEHSDFDAPLDPDAVRRQARGFSWNTSFGTDMVHPCQIALLTD